MPDYVDGFVLTIPKAKLAAYRKLATKAGKIWRDCGALEYRECVLDDANAPDMIPFPKLTKAGPDDVVIFAWAVFQSRRHRDATNKKIMADPRIAALCAETKGVVDCRRMAYGGFKALVAQ
jgi:uncharacterized protein YbaA (DUF1428 family)